MTEKKLDENGRRFAEYSEWYQFLLKTKDCDMQHETTKPVGWFWGIYFLDRFQRNIKSPSTTIIKEILPEKHYLKEILGDHYSDESTTAYFNEKFEFLDQESVFPLFVKYIKTRKDEKEIAEIDFSKLNFKEDIDFSNFVFPMDVSFAGSKFSGKANFTNAVFCGNANFDGAVFSDEALFYKAKFARETYLSGIDFHQKDCSISFTEAVFSYTVIMKGTKFHGETYFEETKFSDDAVFENAHFCGTVSFKDAIFSGKATFTDAKFFNEIKFDWTKFKDFTNFINTEFKQYVPSSHKAEFHSNTSWSWEVELWPQVENHINYQTDEDYKTRIKDNQNAYENLSSQMKGLDKYHDEHFFYRQEMCCRRWRSSPAVKFFYYLYEKLADYGYGIKQALWGWFWHMVLGVQAIVIVTFICACWKGWTWETAKGVLCSIPLSFANAHGFLPFHKGALKDCYELFDGNILFNIIWGFQTVLGIVFLFLLLTTIRIRFRLK